MKLSKLFALIKLRMTSRSSKNGATLGVMPDYGYSGPGMRLNGITKGKTAEKFDLKKGDVITRIGNETVTDLMGYMSVMNEYRVGDKVEIAYKRDDVESTMVIQFKEADQNE